VPNAVVSIYDGSGFGKTTATNDAGEFSFTELPSASYELKVSHAGFEVSQRRLGVMPDGSVEYQGKTYALGPGATSTRLDIVLSPSTAMQSMVVTAKAPPEVLEKRHAASPKRIRVGGLVEASKLLESERPVYPESARVRGVEGVVVLEAVISMEGVPLSLTVLKSPDPELSEAALAAVRQWHYKPTLLNGEPIEVVTTITINFRLEE
jgi:TonB family protein